MASKNFSHSGKIIAIEGNQAKINFEAQGACGGCSARSKCGMVDSSTREVIVTLDRGATYNVGDQVYVAISYQMGIFSVFMAYILPLILLIAVLAGAVAMEINEGVAALISLATVAIYFGIIYLFRSKLDKQIKFTIEK